MIFITGATGFIGNTLIKQLARWNKELRVLITPAENNFVLPKNIPIEIAISNLNDEKNLRAALKNVTTIIHLASDEHRGHQADLMSVDIQGTSTLLQVARDTKVEHVIYVSHLGAEPSSAYPLLKAKGMAENIITQSGIPFTILKSGPVFGTGDHFIQRLIQFIRIFPFFVIIPEKGHTLLHPICVDDLVSALLLTIDNQKFYNSQYQLGGPEYFTFHDLCKDLLLKFHRKKTFVPFPVNTIRTGLLFAEQIWKNLPFSGFDLDYLAIDRIAPFDTLPRFFGVIPSRLQDYIETL